MMEALQALQGVARATVRESQPDHLVGQVKLVPPIYMKPFVKRHKNAGAKRMAE